MNLKNTELPSNYRIVDHVDGGKCILDCSTFKYYQLPEIKRTVKSKGKEYDFYDYINEFINSKSTIGVVPVFCNWIKKVGKRIKVELLSELETYQFFNVERVNGSWSKNDIDKMEKFTGYFILIEKNKQAEKDFLIKFSKKIR